MEQMEMRRLVQDWLEAWNANDAERIRQLYDKDAVLYQAPMKKRETGVEHIISRMSSLNQMSSDGVATIRHFYQAEDAAILETNIAGTHTGQFLGYAPTQRRFDIDTCLILRMRGGKIVEHVTYLDTASILRALGLLQIPGALPHVA